MDPETLLNRKVERCRALYEEYSDDSWSYSCHVQWEAVAEYAEKLRSGMTPSELLKFLRAELPKLEQEALK